MSKRKECYQKPGKSLDYQVVYVDTISMVRRSLLLFFQYHKTVFRSPTSFFSMVSSATSVHISTPGYCFMPWKYPAISVLGSPSYSIKVRVIKVHKLQNKILFSFRSSKSYSCSLSSQVLLCQVSQNKKIVFSLSLLRRVWVLVRKHSKELSEMAARPKFQSFLPMITVQPVTCRPRDRAPAGT